LKRFFANHKYSAASTNDFIKTFRQISGMDVDQFFKGWFDSYTLPEVKVSHTLQKKGDGFLLRFFVSQKRGPFVFPLSVEWSLNGKNITEMLIVDEKEKSFDFELETKPRKIKINRVKAVPGKID